MYNTLITAEALKAQLETPGWVIVDCRYDLGDTEAGRRAWRAGHIPGAAYAHLHDDLSTAGQGGGCRHPLPDPERLVQLFSRFGIGPGSQVVAYDDAGGSVAARLWWMLRYMGHECAAVLDGGIGAWREAGYPVESIERRPQGERFSGAAHPGMLVTAPQVLGCARLIDSRDPARYRGEQETLDPIAGHIPGARNRFWKNNLDSHGMFQSPQLLRDQLSRQYGGVPAEEVVFYCGSGVTACHNVLAAAVAGLALPKLYAGSWSEWCADRSRPVATGEG